MVPQVALGLVTLAALAFARPDQTQYYQSKSNVMPQPYVYEYKPRMVYYYPRNGLSNPVYFPNMGMSPEYHNLVYNYITGMAGNEHPPQVQVFPQYPHHVQHEQTPKPQELIPEKVEEFGTDMPTEGEEETETEPMEVDMEPMEGQEEGMKEETTEKPGLNDHYIPSDFLLLSHKPQSQFFGNFDAIKMKNMKFQSNPTALPPIGGVLSNYVLLREHPQYQNYLPFARKVMDSEKPVVSKRQAWNFYQDGGDGVIISADALKEKGSEGDKETTTAGAIEEEQPAVAQSKPSAIALAGPGGVAQASPVGTALVGPGGLAVSAPSGTAVAGPAGQGALQISDEKHKLAEKKTKE